MDIDIFTVRATKCTRCGGILLSDYGLKHGMGHTCKRKHDEENAPLPENQLTFEEYTKEKMNHAKTGENY